MHGDDNVTPLRSLVVRGVDPRRAGWEVTPTAYHVYFWGSAGDGVMLAGGTQMASSDEYEVSGARDVTDVLEWARQNARGRTFTIYAAVENVLTDHGIVQVYGTDPT